jgi:hypothetical protein
LLQTDGNTALTIDGSQQVGIGTDNPQAKLDVNGSATFAGDVTCANLIANDVIMSNMGCETGNEVDGTQGHWVMQEGEDELFVINRRTGKRYAMSLRPMD